MRALQHASLGDDSGGVVLRMLPLSLVAAGSIDEANDGGERCRGRGARAIARSLAARNPASSTRSPMQYPGSPSGGHEQVGSARRRFGDRGEHLGGVPSMSPLVGLSWARAMRMKPMPHVTRAAFGDGHDHFLVNHWNNGLDHWATGGRRFAGLQVVVRRRTGVETRRSSSTRNLAGGRRDGFLHERGRAAPSSQSAVSRQILLLEEELNEQLFLRLGRKIRITHAGTTLLGLSQRMFDDLEQTRASILDQQQTVQGTLRLVGGMTVCLYVFRRSSRRSGRSTPTSR